MTEVLAQKVIDHYRLRVTNHADTQEVCSAVSTLVYTLEGTLFNNDEAEEHISTLEPGKVDIKVRGKDRVNEDFHMTVIGFLQLQKAYPEEIKVNQNILNYSDFGGEKSKEI